MRQAKRRQASSGLAIAGLAIGIVDIILPIVMLAMAFAFLN